MSLLFRQWPVEAAWCAGLRQSHGGTCGSRMESGSEWGVCEVVRRRESPILFMYWRAERLVSRLTSPE